jgi:hypothetical protein
VARLGRSFPIRAHTRKALIGTAPTLIALADAGSEAEQLSATAAIPLADSGSSAESCGV